jgi:hypothetical protein
MKIAGRVAQALSLRPQTSSVHLRGYLFVFQNLLLRIWLPERVQVTRRESCQHYTKFPNAVFALSAILMLPAVPHADFNILGY